MCREQAVPWGSLSQPCPGAQRAAEVRDLTGGDETIPVVVVGTQAMVNSSARQVIAAVRAGQPSVLPAQGIRPASRLAQVAGLLTRRKPRPGHAVDEPSRHTPV